MRTLVLVHAFPLDHRMYDDLRPAIEAAGWRLFTPDLRGFGAADDFDGAPSLDVCADDLVALLDQHGVDRAVIGGTSVGGYVTMAMLRRAPERMAGLILIDTKASADAPEALANRLRVAEQVAAAETTEAFWRAMLPNVLGQTTQAERPAVVERTRNIMSDSRPLAVANLQRAMAARPDSHADLAGCRLPVLSLRGSEDAIASAADHARMIGGIPDAVHHDIPGAGHLPSLEAPADTAARIVEFLHRVETLSC